MANKGKRMLFEKDYDYLQDLVENHPDPSASWGGGSGGSDIQAGTGIEITGTDTKTISLDTTPNTFEISASTGMTLEVENQNPLYKDAKLQMTSAGSTRLEGATVSLEGNNVYLNSDNAPYYVNNTSHEYKTLATTDQLFSGNYNDLINKPTIPDAVSGTNDGTNWTSLTIGEDTYGLASGGGATYTAGTGIDITNNVISIDNTVALKSELFSGDYTDLTNKPDLSIYAETADLATVATTGDYDDLLNKPTIPTVPTNISAFTNDSGYITGIDSSMVITALGYTPGTSNFSGSYTDLTNKPDLSIYAQSSSLATVATTGSYSDLTGTPTIPAAVSGTNDGTNWTSLTIGSDTYAIGGGSTPSNMVTTDTAQNITASKTFKGTANIYVQSGNSYTASDTLITNNSVYANEISCVRVSGTEFILQDATTTGHAQLKVKDFSQGFPATDYLITIPAKTGTMALTSDITNVSGTNDGTNWTSLTIGSDTYNIPAGGGSTPTNMVTTDTAQEIVASKTFASHGYSEYNVVKVNQYNNNDVLTDSATLKSSSIKFLDKSYSNNYHFGELTSSVLQISTDDYKNVQFLYDHISWRKGAGSSNVEDFYFGGSSAGTNKIARLKDLPTGLPTAPTTQGTYTLQVTVDAQGNKTYNWV